MMKVVFSLIQIKLEIHRLVSLWWVTRRELWIYFGWLCGSATSASPRPKSGLSTWLLIYSL